MFTTLIASSPERRTWSMSGWGGVSVGFHVALVLGVLWFSTRPVEVREMAEERVVYVVFPEEEVPPPVDVSAVPPPPPEVPPAPKAPDPPPVPELVQGFQELELPREIPVNIPAPSTIRIRALDYSGLGAAGGTGEGYAEPADTVVEPLPLAVVDRLPQMKDLRDLINRMHALYPPIYRAAGIEGRAIVQFVVSKEGRVEAERMSVISTTHPEFGPASLELVRLVRFEPARRNGRPVPVWVQLPVDWRID